MPTRGLHPCSKPGWWSFDHDLTEYLMQPSPEQQTLFNLIKAALWPGQNNAAFPEGSVKVNWNQIIALAAKQGVSGVSHDGFTCGGRNTEMLPALPKAEQIRWALSVKYLEARHKRQREALKELVTLFRDNGIEVLLLKGIGVAANYPIPLHRESGDLDIFLYDNHEKGNQLIESLGIPVNREGRKHSTFFFHGAPVENHFSFLDIEPSQTNRNLESHLLEILSSQGHKTINIDEVEVRIPPPDFTALFLTRHDITHFLASGLVLRHLCDLSIFFSRNASSINFIAFYKILEQESQLKLFTSFIDLAQQYLGMPLDSIPVLMTEERTSDKIFLDTLNNKRRKIGTEELLKWWVVKRKAVGAMHLFRSKWKYDLAEDGIFYQRLMGSLKAAFNI